MSKHTEPGASHNNEPQHDNTSTTSTSRRQSPSTTLTNDSPQHQHVNPMQAPPTQHDPPNQAIQTLQTQNLSLLHTLARHLPFGQVPQIPSIYHPSIASHTNPSNIPTLRPQVEATLLQAAEEIIRAHIRALKRYNDVRDVGRGLIGMVAEGRGGTARRLYEEGEFGVGVED